MATDIDTALLDAQEWPSPVTVRPHDVTRDDLTPAEVGPRSCPCGAPHLPGP